MSTNSKTAHGEEVATYASRVIVHYMQSHVRASAVVQFGIKQLLASGTAMCLVLCISAMHGKFGFAMLFVSTPLAIAMAAFLGRASHIGRALSLCSTVFVSGGSALVIHGLVDGNVLLQPSRLAGGVAVGAVAWGCVYYLRTAQAE